MTRFRINRPAARQAGAYTTTQTRRTVAPIGWRLAAARTAAARQQLLRAAAPSAASGRLPAASDNHYETLGVSPSASQEEIHEAYQRLAKQWHPDSNKDPQAPLRMAAIDRAFDVLRDPIKRSKYDQLGEEGLRSREESAAAGAPAAAQTGPEISVQGGRGPLSASDLRRAAQEGYDDDEEETESEYDVGGAGVFGGNFLGPLGSAFGGLDDLLSDFFGGPFRQPARPRQFGGPKMETSKQGVRRPKQQRSHIHA